jgi:hypothetical protein
MIFMRSLSIVVMSQIKLIPTPSRLVYFVLKAQPFFINFDILVTGPRLVLLFNAGSKPGSGFKARYAFETGGSSFYFFSTKLGF